MAWPASADSTAPDTPVTFAAWGATVAWLLISALVFFGMSGGEAGLDPLRVMMVPVAVFGPVALIWIAAFLTRRVSALTRAVERLEAGAAGGDTGLRLDALVAGQRDLRAALAAAGTAPMAAPEAGTADTAPGRWLDRTARPDDPAAPPAGAAKRPKPSDRTAAASEPEAPAPAETPPEKDAAPAEPGARPAGTPRGGPDDSAPADATPGRTADATPGRTTNAAARSEASASAGSEATAATGPDAEAGSVPPDPSAPAGTEAPAPLLPAGTLVHALHFPADAEDREGFGALRQALRDPATKPVVMAAQDMLTLLSELGLYMDDVTPSPAPAASWRRFAGGERGGGVGDIAGPGDAGAQEKIGAKLRSDPVFGDTAAHFTRLFERLLAEREPVLEDHELLALAGTRSARAFTMVGRARGTFD